MKIFATNNAVSLYYTNAEKAGAEYLLKRVKEGHNFVPTSTTVEGASLISTFEVESPLQREKIKDALLDERNIIINNAKQKKRETPVRKYVRKSTITKAKDSNKSNSNTEQER